jgi:signal transduction histidine kinase
MLQEFLQRERDTILGTAKQKAQAVRWRSLSRADTERGWEIFYDELTQLCASCYSPESRTEETGQHGKEAIALGYAITEAVQTYNIIYQSIVEAAAKSNYQIAEPDLKNLSQSLDTAIAQAVTQFERAQSAQSVDQNERIGFLAHELRNSLQSATIAVEMVESGAVGIDGQTGDLLRSSLARMAELIDSALTRVRLQIEPEVHATRLRPYDVISEVEITAAYQARARDLALCVEASREIEVVVDRQLLISALSNLVQNALKFTHPSGTVTVRTIETEDRVQIEVQDQCGGLPHGKVEELFRPGVQLGSDRTGVGLGLAIAREALERNGGELRVRDLPGEGCIFTIDLPKPPLNQVTTETRQASPITAS